MTGLCLREIFQGSLKHTQVTFQPILDILEDLTCLKNLTFYQIKRCFSKD